MCFSINDDKNLSLNLPGLQNLGFEKSSKNSCDFMDTMLKAITIYQDDSHNSHWLSVCLGRQDKYIFLALHRCGTNPNKFEDLVKLNLIVLKQV